MTSPEPEAPEEGGARPSADGSKEGGVVLATNPDRIRQEILQSLSETPRRLPPRFFYDARGARLFEEITRLEEYYLTDAEIEILRTRMPEVARFVGPRARMVEYGSGSGEKTWIVLRALEQPSAYVPVDVAREQLMSFAAQVRRKFPAVEVLPVAADYTRLETLPWPRGNAHATMAFFPGSTVGNLESGAAVAFLRRIGGQAGPGSLLLIGADLVKERDVLERAYDDEQGVTARFNLNILRHLNRLLGADFDLEAFRHRAVWNEARSRMEMHLVSLRDQRVRLGPHDGNAAEVEIGAGEYLVTEHSYKFQEEGFRDLARRAGYEPIDSWTDEAGRFSVHLLRFDSPPGR